MFMLQKKRKPKKKLNQLQEALFFNNEQIFSTRQKEKAGIKGKDFWGKRYLHTSSCHQQRTATTQKERKIKRSIYTIKPMTIHKNSESNRCQLEDYAQNLIRIP